MLNERFADLDQHSLTLLKKLNREIAPNDPWLAHVNNKFHKYYTEERYGDAREHLVRMIGLLAEDRGIK